MEHRMGFLTEEIEELKKRGIYSPTQTTLDTPQVPEAVVNGKKVVVMCSNNYLGLTVHPKLKEAALKATEEWGVGAGAVRPIIGTMRLHVAVSYTHLTLPTKA